MKTSLFPQYSDAAKRVSAEYNMHRTADLYGSMGKWIAVALADGSSDHVLYDSKRDAVRHQSDEFLCAYIQISPAQMTERDAETFLGTMRKLYDKGIRLVDPDDRHGGPDIIPRAAKEDNRSQLRSILTRGRSRPRNLLIPGKDF